MARVISVWLPDFATDRLASRQPGWRERPFATVGEGQARRLAAVSPAARGLGLRPGMMATQARALAPGVDLVAADPAGDARQLAALAERVTAFSPWAAPERPLPDAEDPALALPGAGLWLDIAGCAQLLGGEAALLGQLVGELARLGFTTRAAIADAPGAAWAWARFGDPAAPILAPGGEPEALAGLPPAALRLPARLALDLAGLGLRRIGELLALPRPDLAARFGRALLWRLDQALGREPEPIEPLRPPAPHRVRMAFPEPIGRDEDLAAALRRLIAHLCRRLEDEGTGLRRLALLAFRADGSVAEIPAGCGAPSRDPAHLFRLFEERLGSLDAGFGIEALRLDARELAPLPARQDDLAGGGGAEESLAQLLDGLANRLGNGRVLRLVPQASHLPERAVRPRPAAAPPDGTAPAGWRNVRRPVLLLEHPEPLEVTAPLPDAPPLQFRWRHELHRVAQVDGPERIACEWWRDPRPDRDYYRIEDREGRRFWLFREGAGPGQWFLHGVFP